MEVLTIVAIVVGPIAAVLVTRWVDRRREQHQRRMEIFRTLMRTRRTPMVPEHVGALNLIEIGYARDKEVISCWKDLFNHFGTPQARRTDEQLWPEMSEDERGARDLRFNERLSGERQRLLAKLLHAMAGRLRFKAEQLEIFEGGYTPQGWHDVEAEQTFVRRFAIQLALGNRRLPISVFDYTQPNSPPGNSVDQGPPDADTPKQ